MTQDGQRVETGAVQFDDDWPGLFIRGDEALAMAQVLDRVLILAAETGAPMGSDAAEVEALRDLLLGVER